MPRIADHHKPGSWRYDADNPHVPSNEWPDASPFESVLETIILKKRLHRQPRKSSRSPL